LVSTAVAVFVSGVTLFITDTIMGGYATDLQTDSFTTSTVRQDYNLFENTPVFTGNVTSGGHSLVGGPLFADSLAHLSPGSPAIDHGTDVGVYVDFEGDPRPVGPADIGWDEYVAKLFLSLVRR
jgi:hypothetical protein